ncbi:hypothetical protein N665_1386s0002 [Sinapis alba]|nr:hypothetical protein N665_1386s0002 [Sinapis alba]
MVCLKDRLSVLWLSSNVFKCQKLVLCCYCYLSFCWFCVISDCCCMYAGHLREVSVRFLVCFGDLFDNTVYHEDSIVPFCLPLCL